MSEEQMHFTGLPAGDEHNRVVAKGDDFLVWMDYESNVHAEPYSEDAVQALEESDKDWSEWTRVRALTAEDAASRCVNAHDQWRQWANFQPITVNDALNVVLTPLAERSY